MGKKVSVVTRRKVFNHVSWQPVNEWEEDFAKFLGNDLIDGRGNSKNFFQRLIYNSNLYSLLPKKNDSNWKVIFHMVPPYEYNYYSSSNFINIIIDCWKPSLSRIEKYLHKDRLVFLGSLQAVNYFNKRDWNNVHYLPVSVSKRYYVDVPSRKDIDLFIYGRNNLQLKEWAYKLFDDSKFHVVKAILDKNNFYAYSNKMGPLGNVSSRSDLFILLNRSKNVSVSAPGIDEKNEFDLRKTGGFSPVTPRFFETLVTYANGVGIYNDNEDYKFCRISEFTSNITCFKELEAELAIKRDNEEMKYKIEKYLTPHWAHRRIENILNFL